MAFQPIDIQVNVMQASNVAEMATNEREGPERALDDRTQKWIEERQSEENTSDETAERDENDAVDEDESGNTPNNTHGASGESSGEEDDSSSQNSEPDKGTYLDLTT
jgi:hypothetical protein